MTSTTTLAIIAATPGAALVVIVTAALAMIIRHERVPDHQGADDAYADQLAGVGAQLRAGGAHTLIAATAYEQINHHRGHIPRHALEDTPPSITRGLEFMTPTERARELTRQLGQATWRPTRAPERWARRAQLELARRLRAAGTPTRLAGPRTVLP